MKKSVILYFIMCGLIYASWISLDNTPTPTAPTYTINENNTNRVKFNIKIHGFVKTDTMVNGVNYQMIYIPQEFSTSDTGKSCLPIIKKYLAIQPDQGTAITYYTVSETLLTNYNIFPYLKSQHDPDSTPAFIIDTAFYQSINWYPEKIIEKSLPAIMMDLRVINLSVQPFIYKPHDKLLNVKKEINVTVEFQGTDTMNQISGSPIIVNDKLDELYKACVLNYVEQVDNSVPDGGRSVQPDGYYILVPDAYYDAIQPLAQWRAKCGYNVKTYKLSQIPGYSGSQSDTVYIRNFIRNNVTPCLYNNVLLVGNKDQIHFYTNWKQSDGFTTILSDNYYSMIYGNDDIPDIILSRLYVNSQQDVETFTEKIFHYERYPTYHPYWYPENLKLLYVGAEPECYNACNLIYHQMLERWGYPTSVMEQITGTSTVFIPINNGIGIINYCGHGTPTAWWQLGGAIWSIEDIPTYLTNQDKYPIIMNICCNNANFHAAPVTMVEAWTLTPNKGAVAAIGATEKFWGGQPSPNDLMVRFDTTLWWWISNGPSNQFICPIGSALFRAKLLMIQMGGIYPLSNARSMMLDGEPELSKWWFNGTSLTATHPTQLYTGSNTITISVTRNGSGIGGAYVGIYKNNDILDLSVTDGGGNTTRTIDIQNPGALYITARAPLYWPYEGSCTVKRKLEGSPYEQNSTPVLKKFSFISSHLLPDQLEIQFYIEIRNRHIELNFYNNLGQLVQSYKYDNLKTGLHTIKWNYRNSNGKDNPAGIYFGELKDNDNLDTVIKKFIIM